MKSRVEIIYGRIGSEEQAYSLADRARTEGLEVIGVRYQPGTPDRVIYLDLGTPGRPYTASFDLVTRT